ncbi:DUF2103 domain-containing protein [Desulfosporosinus sp.]|uniref:DUF2103 domain-containing protein n=1 Tax=Desulfosporosinus sp. TaxID=157907 RepID=UPI0025B98439|nr:DUF2103 domain-containing protein [Desulfosporosinus sp.]MBC2725902.1 hypothetical protein [Desulfosporosinus sp.]
MKHRRNKLKREHGIIQNALKWLESLSGLAEVTDIIPGVIDVNRSSERGIVYKYKTQTGCKLLLKSSGSIQEAFVVTKYPELVREWVNKEFPPDLPTTTANIAKTNSNNDIRKKVSKGSSKPEVKLEFKPSSQRTQLKKKERSQGNVNTSYDQKDHKVVHVSDQLDHSTLKAMKQLKKTLENENTSNLRVKGNRHRK